MSDQLFGFNERKFKELIQSSVSDSIAAYFAEKDLPKEEKPIIYRTREYVKDLLHTTYPTLQKYSESGLLNPVYFGRRVLYREDELNLALPTITTLLNSGNKKKVA